MLNIKEILEGWCDTITISECFRFLNHSCDPNVHVQHVLVDTHDLRLPWSSFFATRDIKAGEVYTFFYLTNSTGVMLEL